MTEIQWQEELKKFANRLLAPAPNQPLDYHEKGEWGFNKFVFTERAISWDHFLKWVNAQTGSWYYRGQKEAAWSLTNSLDRSVFRQKTTENSTSIYHLPREAEERELLFRFQQQVHQYLPRVPANDDWCSWFALMQHYGVPTRFLDWTTSPFAGMYFALEEEPIEEAEYEQKWSALWAIDRHWLEEKAGAILKGASVFLPIPDDPKTRAEYLNKLFWTEQATGVILAVNPLMSNDRMAAQQGLFLFKLYAEAPFFGVFNDNDAASHTYRSTCDS